MPRNPDARRGQRGSVRPEHHVGRTVCDDSAAISEHNHACDEIAPHGDAVLDDDEGGAGARDHPFHRVAHLDDSCRVEIRGGFVEQNQTRPHGEQPGEREPLLLPPRQRAGGGVEGYD